MNPFDVVICVLFVATTLLLLTLSAASLRWMLWTWNTEASIARRRSTPNPDATVKNRFSLLVPARDEVAVLGATLDRLLEQDHPLYEVIVIVGHDDPATAAIAHAYARRHPNRIRVAVDENPTKNKPKALNVGLAAARYEIIGVFDAEDEVAPRLLRAVDEKFHDPSTHIVQGGVQLMNFRSRWFTVRNVLEYFFHFGSRLHLHAQQGLIPLGGNTVFMRRWLLDAIGGWDEECLAEDCEVGMRLSAAGARTVVLYDPDLVTKEEAPTDLRGFVRQRTRWDQGFLQVLKKGEWRRFSLRPQRFMAWFVLVNPFLQGLATVLAVLQIILGVTLGMPLAITMLAFLPLMLTCVIVVTELVGLYEFCRMFGEKARLRDYARVAIGHLPYHVLLAVAALRAIVLVRRGANTWEKTAHSGAHRPVVVGAEPLIDLTRVEPEPAAAGRLDADDVESVA